MMKMFVIKCWIIENRQIYFKENKFGKPYIYGYPQFCFNISHTRNAIAVSFSTQNNGIDIEKVREPSWNIFKECFTLNEQKYIQLHRNPKYAFYEIWTKKEAYVKWKGIGLTKKLNSFDVIQEDNDKMFWTEAKGEYIVSCCSKEMRENRLYIMNEEELLNVDL